MSTRLLPADEWPRLAGTALEPLWPTLNPETCRIIVVERDGQIVGHHVLMTVLHAECLWIHPDHRGRASVARRLWGAVRAEAHAYGASGVMTTAMDDVVRGLLTHVDAVRVPGDHYLVPIDSKGATPCLP